MTARHTIPPDTIESRLYDTKEIAAIVAREGRAEFLPPHAAYHAKRAAGAPTQYGETVAVMLRALSKPGKDGVRGVHLPAFLSKYNEAFGVGGHYVGYADHVNRVTVSSLLALATAQERALAPAAALPGPLRMAAWTQLRGVVEGSAPAAVPAAAAALAARAAPDAAPADVAAFVAVAGALADTYAAWVGAADKQTPGLALLPPLVARYAGHADLPHLVAGGVKALQAHDEAAVWLGWAARVLEAAVLGVPPHAAVTSNLPRLEQPYRAAVESAVHAADEDAAAAKAAAAAASTSGAAAEDDAASPAAAAAVAAAAAQRLLDVTGRLGTSCDLSKALPCAVYIALRAAARAAPGDGAFAAAVRDNILAGGDSCGRALFIGALMGAAAGGVPDDLLARVAEPLRTELAALTEGIHEPVTAETVSEGHIRVHPHSAGGGHGAAPAATH